MPTTSDLERSEELARLAEIRKEERAQTLPAQIAETVIVVALVVALILGILDRLGLL